MMNRYLEDLENRIEPEVEDITRNKICLKHGAMMNLKQDMLAVLGGRCVNRIPWVPRLDLWYNANKRAGTLPSGYEDASLRDIVDDLGWGYHAVIPNFKDITNADELVDRGLGIYNWHMIPFKITIDDVTREVFADGDRITVTYHTPNGDVTTSTLHDEQMRKAGISVSVVTKHAINSVEDIDSICYLFDNVKVQASQEGYRRYSDYVGDRGICVGFVNFAASPMQYVLRDLIPYEELIYMMTDYPDETQKLLDSVGRYYEQMIGLLPSLDAKVIFWGANYDASITCPPLFEEHILPWLKRASDVLHRAGKYLLTHADGENTGLLRFYKEAGIDVADSICPKPMTKLTFKEVRNYFGDDIKILGGIPSVSLVKDIMGDFEFEEFVDDFLEQIGDGKGLILGISDTTPPGAEFKRLKRIAERIESFGRPG